MRKRHLLNFLVSALFLLMANVLMAQTISIGYFAAPVLFTTGSNPVSVVTGDIDGDGKPDMVVANFSSNTVSVYLNTGSSGIISFAPMVDFSVGALPRIVAIGDIDGDGKPDLVTANLDAANVSVLLNTSSIGKISFAPEVHFTTASQPVWVSIGDINGDGKPDLATANANAANVSVLLNTGSRGSISFAPKLDFETGASPRSVVIGDIDGDGKPDLSVANSLDSATGNSVSVLRNTGSSGSISFATDVRFATGTSPSTVAIGDIDGDGKPDLITANKWGDDVSVLRNTSSIGIINASSFAGMVDFVAGVTPTHLSIGDIDGDGKPDLVVMNQGSTGDNGMSVLRNTSSSGSISFEGKVDFATGNVPINVLISDIDGDGKPDLAVANFSSDNVAVLHNLLGIKTGSTDWIPSNLNAYAIRNVQIRVEGEVSKNAIATLYDIQGRVILVKNMEEGSLNVIPTPNLKTGIYMLFVKDNEKAQRFKVPVNE